MNKKEAADYLGISTRALEYHVNKGNISARYERGKTGDVAVFEERELRELKAKLQRPARSASAAIVEAPQSPEAETRSLARLSEAPAALAVLERLAAVYESAGRASVPVPVADKLTLSLVEASQLSGLSRGHLRQAIDEKKLKARIIGKGWRVKRDDLEAYVKKL